MKDNKLTIEEQKICQEAINFINSNRESWDPWYPTNNNSQHLQIYDEADKMGLQASDELIELIGIIEEHE